jgi:hypothetical protein
MHNQIPLHPSLSRCFTRTLCIALALTGAATPLAIAQPASPNLASPAASISEPTLSLPDSPGAVSSSSARPTAQAQSFETVHNPQLATASHTDKYILPGQTAPSISAGDKVVLGLKDAVSPLAFAGWISAAGYSQLLNNSPNYGTDVGAFGQRLGAAVLRASSEGILSDSIMAPIFHEDPRYYLLGRSHGFFHRVVYAATRTIITRTDSGRTSPNLALLSGNLEGAILTNVYYPSSNRTVKDTAVTFGGSIGGSAVGFLVSEFLSDTLELVHLKASK